MGKREDAHRELEHALAAMADERARAGSRGLWRDHVLATRSMPAYTAFTHAGIATEKLTRHRRCEGNERFEHVKKLARVMLDVLLGDEE